MPRPLSAIVMRTVWGDVELGRNFDLSGLGLGLMGQLGSIAFLDGIDRIAEDIHENLIEFAGIALDRREIAIISQDVYCWVFPLAFQATA